MDTDEDEDMEEEVVVDIDEDENLEEVEDEGFKGSEEERAWIKFYSEL